MKGYDDITYRYLKGQPKRTILTIVGIILAVALITGMGTLLVGFREYEINRTAEEKGDYYAQFCDVPASKALKIAGSDGISKSALISDEGSAIVCAISDRERANDPEIPLSRYLQLVDCDQQGFSMFSLRPEEGRLPAAPGELMVDYGVLERLPGQPGLGDRIKLPVGTWYIGNTKVPQGNYKWTGNEVFRKKVDMEFTIVGLSRPRIESSRNYISTGFSYMSRSGLGQQKKYDVYVKTESVANAIGKAEAIAQAVGLEKVKDAKGNSDYPIKYNDSLLRLSAQSSDGSVNNGMFKIVVFFALMIMLCTIAVIYNAFNISVLERISQFGLLRCVGASPGQIRYIVFKEAAILSLIGVPLGLACGILAMKILIAAINSFNSNALVFLQDMPVRISVPVMAASALVGVITVFLSALGPASRAGRVSPVEAVRNTGSYAKEDFSKVRKSLPGLSRLGVEVRMAFKNLRRNRGRFRITVFSMVISIALYIVFGSFVNYMFTVGAVESPPNADFMWSIKEKTQSSFSEAQYKDVKALPGVARVYKDLSADVSLEVKQDKINRRFAEIETDLFKTKKGTDILYPKGHIISYGPDAARDLRQIMSRDELAEMDRVNGVILVSTNQVYDTKQNKSVIIKALNYQVGDSININSTADAGQKKPFAGTVKVMKILDKSFVINGYNQEGDVYMITTDQIYKRITGEKAFRQMAIKLEPGAAPAPVAEYLKKMSSRDPIYDYVDIAEAAASMKNAALTVSIFLYGFVAVIALIGSLNIINTISTNLILRTRELSVLRAVGMTRRGIRRLVTTEGVLYGIVAAIYGTVVGTGLAYVLYKFMSGVRGFDWMIPWMQIVTATTGAVIIALVSGYIPLKRINEGIIIENIRMVE